MIPAKAHEWWSLVPASDQIRLLDTLKSQPAGSAVIAIEKPEGGRWPDTRIKQCRAYVVRLEIGNPLDKSVQYLSLSQIEQMEKVTG